MTADGGLILLVSDLVLRATLGACDKRLYLILSV